MVLLKKLALISGISLCSILFSTTPNADDIFKGMRGPTNWQLDTKVSYSENQQKVRTTAINPLLKYWNGDKLGLFGFLNLPYRNTDNLTKSSKGLGDISLGIGPRGSLNNFHWISYAGLIFPTGNDKSKPILGNGRLDKKVGLLGTYFIDNKKYEIDGTLEYNFTGRNSSGINYPNEIFIGMLGCREITKQLRFATGLTALIKDNDYVTNCRTVLRYTFSPGLHFELAGDTGISSHNIPQSIGIGLYMRNNF